MKTFGEGSGFRAAGLEITTLRLGAAGRTPKPQRAAARPAVRMAYDASRRDFVLTPICQWRGLGVADALGGPAVVEHATTIVFIGGTQEAGVDRHGKCDRPGTGGDR